jgi:hypothetical protein
MILIIEIILLLFLISCNYFWYKKNGLFHAEKTCIKKGQYFSFLIGK